MKLYKFLLVVACLLVLDNVYSQNWSPSFGVDGVVNLKMINRNTRGAIVLNVDDNIIVGFNSDTSQFGATYDRNVYIVKLKSDGSVEPNFGINGSIFIPSSGLQNITFLNSIKHSEYDSLFYCSVRFQTETKIFRFNRFGVIDTSYGINGYVTAFGESFVIQSNGKVVALGVYTPDNLYFHHRLKRYNNDGSVDLSFGNSGEVIQDLTQYSKDIIAKAELYNDKIIVIANSYNTTIAESFANISRYNSDGSLDLNFGLNGYTVTLIGSEEHGRFIDLDVSLNGEIIVAGKCLQSGGPGGFGANKALLVKFNQNGILMNSFNGSGIKIFTSIHGGNDQFATVGFMSDGSVIAGGSSGSDFSTLQSYYYLTKVTQNGVLDYTFFDAGFLVTKFENSLTNYVFDLDISSNDEIFSTGIKKDSIDDNFVAVVCKMDYSTVGLNENNATDFQISIFPNPSLKSLNISTSEEIKQIRIYSMDGKLMLDQSLTFQNKITLNIENLSEGVYMLNLTNSNKERVTKKFIKK